MPTDKEYEQRRQSNEVNMNMNTATTQKEQRQLAEFAAVFKNNDMTAESLQISNNEMMKQLKSLDS